jgi:hypothetical protein
MGANTTAQVMIESMVRIAREEFETGNYAKAIDTATNLIQAIETNGKQTRNTFGQVLVPMYCMRAQSRFVLGKRNDDQEMTTDGQQDIKRAVQAYETHYPEPEPERKAKVLQTIHNTIADEAQIRKASMETILTMERPETSQPPAKSKPMFRAGGMSFLGHAASFVIGVILWGIGLWVTFAIPVDAEGLIQGLYLTPLLLMLLGIRGCDLFPRVEGDKYRYCGKAVVLVFLALTGVGMVAVCYWTGKGFLRLIKVI